MSQDLWTAVDAFVGDALIPADPVAVVSAERPVGATTIQTVGSKGHDGFTLAMVAV